MAIYYVRPDGNNTNAGTGALATQAWATITKAASTMVAGDTVYIAPGVYRETISPTNAGSGDSYISYIGDPVCQYFIDMPKGDVIIDGKNSDTSNTISRTYGINSLKGYIIYKNLIIRNISQCGYSGAGQGVTLENIKFLGFMYNGVSTSGNYITLKRCVIKAMNTPINTYGAYCYYCIIEGGQSAGIGQNGEHYFFYCKIKASNIITNAYGIYFYGCVMDFYRPETGYGASILLSGNSSAQFYGCIINCHGNYGIYQINNVNVTVMGCKFINCYNGIQLYNGGTGSINIDSNEFVNCYNCVSTARNGITIYRCAFIDCYSNTQDTNLNFSECVFQTNINSNGTITGSYYGTCSESYKQGMFISSTDKIKGTKSLKIRAHDYFPVYIMWIPCEAGKAKTVKFKTSNTNTGQTSNVIFGDQNINVPTGGGIKDISITYTHHSTELVPLFFCGRGGASTSDYILVDDIKF